MTAASVTPADATSGTDAGELVVVRAAGAAAATSVARRSAVSDYLASTLGLPLGPGPAGSVVPLLGLEHCELARLQIERFDEIAGPTEGPTVLDGAGTLDAPHAWLSLVQRTIDLLGVVELDAPPPPESEPEPGSEPDPASDDELLRAGARSAGLLEAAPTPAPRSAAAGALARLDDTIAELEDQVRQDELVEQRALAAAELRRSLQLLSDAIAVGSGGYGRAETTLAAPLASPTRVVALGRWFTPVVWTTGALLSAALVLLLTGHTVMAVPISGVSLASGLLVLLDPPSRSSARGGTRRLADALHDDESDPQALAEQASHPAAPAPAPAAGADAGRERRGEADGERRGEADGDEQAARRLEADLRRERLEALYIERHELAEELAWRDEAPEQYRHDDPTDGNPTDGDPTERDEEAGDRDGPSEAIDFERLLEMRRRRLALLHEQRRVTERHAMAERRRGAQQELARLERLLSAQTAVGWRRSASSLFARCSAERYVGLDIATTTATTVALLPDGTTVAVDRLSRRYRQLVALAIRLAVADVEHRGEALVLDDVLVGLDDVLLAATCAALAERSTERRLFVCTGSARVAGALRRAERRARLVELR